MSLPELSIVTGEVAPEYEDYGEVDSLSIYNLDKSGLAIPIALPKLQTVDNVRFSGAIKRYYT